MTITKTTSTGADGKMTTLFVSGGPREVFASANEHAEYGLRVRHETGTITGMLGYSVSSAAGNPRWHIYDRQFLEELRDVIDQVLSRDSAPCA